MATANSLTINNPIKAWWSARRCQKYQWSIGM